VRFFSLNLALGVQGRGTRTRFGRFAYCFHSLLYLGRNFCIARSLECKADICAGGVVGCARTCYESVSETPIVCFDMGGTSTDVSRFGGVFEHVFETTTAGVTIQSPQLDINTVAAGGGSILAWRNGLFAVGPESASSHPGPACYRKGGPLAVTDANLFLGRLLPDFFPKIFGKSEKEALDAGVVAEKFSLLSRSISAETGKSMTPEETAYGFLDVANEAMCRPIRSLTEGKGYEISKHRLAVFGGAGGQHACEIATKLGIKTVIIHKYSSILSAYGMALADVVHEEQEPTNEILDAASKHRLDQRMEALKTKATRHLLQQGVHEDDVYHECYLNMRYKGTETPIMVLRPADGNYRAEFLRIHLREFSFVFPDGRPILVDDARVRAIGRSGKTEDDGARLGEELIHKNYKPVLETQVEREVSTTPDIAS
jgi:5-oxoprolinase (ATP-hydrolysing)